jgi:hypothetical protein
MTTLPTLSHLRGYSTDHLVEAAAHWNEAAGRWDNTYLTVAQEAQTLDWVGRNRDVSVERIHADHQTVRGNAAALTSAAGIAREAAGSLSAAARNVTHLADEAGENGYLVNDDYEVDFPPTRNVAEYKEKYVQAQQYSEDLRFRAAAFMEHEQQTADSLIQAVGDVQCWDNGSGRSMTCVEKLPDGSTVTLPGMPDLSGSWPDAANTNNDGRISMVDNTFKTGGGDDEPSMPVVDAPGDDVFIGTGGGASTQSGLGVEDTRLPSMPSQWPPLEAAPAAPSTPCGPGEFAKDTFKNVAAVAGTTAGALLLPLEGPAMVPSFIGLASGTEAILETSDAEIKCIERGIG